MTTLATTIPEANPIRGLYLTSTAPPVVDRLVTAAEAKECALRLANAAVANGQRPVINRPAAPTDDDVTVLAFIEQRRDPVAEERAKTVKLAAKSVAVESTIEQAGESYAVIDDLSELFGSHFALSAKAKPGSLAAAAVSLLNPGAKPKTPLPDSIEPPQDQRSRLLLAASLILHEAVVLHIESPPLIAPA